MAEMTKEKVKGGYVRRDAKTGRFMEVGSRSGIAKASSQTLKVVEGVSKRHSDALKRLADR
ncbi:MAG: hypothetical protein ACRBBO_02265 [Cognatishimia sp.]